MNVYLFYMRRILKRPGTLVISLLLPIALAYGVVLQYETATNFSITIAVSDDSVRDLIVNELGASQVQTVEVAAANRGGATGVVVYVPQSASEIQANPKGFAPIVTSSSPSAMSGLLVARVNTILSTIEFIAANSPTQMAFELGLRKFASQPETLDIASIVTGNENSLVVISTFNMIVFVMLLLTMTNILMFLKDKEFTTTQRVLVASGRKVNYYLQVVLVFATLGVAELFLIIGALTWGFGVPLNVPWQSIAVVIIAYALLNVFVIALGLLIVSRTTKQSVARIAVTAVVLPLSMLGGALWPLSIMPNWMQNFAAFLPTTWVSQLNSTIFSGFAADPWDVIRPLVLLCVASLVLFGALSRVPSERV